MLGWQFPYAIGRRLESRGQIVRAKKLYSLIYRSGDVKAARLAYRLGHTHFALGNMDQAERYIREAVDLAPNQWDWRYRFGFILEREGRLKDALEQYSAAVHGDDSRAQWHFRRGRVLAALGRQPEAAEEFKLAIAQNPDEANYHAALAECVRKHGVNWEEVKVLQAGVEAHSTSAKWHYRLGEVLFSLNQFSEAAYSFGNALAIDGSKAYWWFQYGRALELAERGDEARVAYESAVARDKKLRASEFGVGVFYQSCGDWKRALAAYERDVHSMGRTAEFMYRIGLAADRCYEWPRAIDAYTQSARLDPSAARTFYRLGFANERSGNFNDAAQAYQIACWLAGRIEREWQFRLGYVLEELGEYQEAAEAYRRTTRAKYSRAWSPEVRDILTQEREDSQEALETVDSRSEQGAVANGAFEHYLDGSIEDLPSLQSGIRCVELGDYFVSLQSWQRAKTAYEMSIDRLDSFSPDVLARLGEVHCRLEDYVAACRAFRQTETEPRPTGVPAGKMSPGAQRNLQYVQWTETLELRDDVILYESHMGKNSSCNPKAIFDELNRRDEFKKYVHVWVLAKDTRPAPDLRGMPNVIFVTRESDLYRRYLATAKYLINNVTFPNYFIRRDGQKYLNTWHGTPVKTLGKYVQSSFFEHKNVARNFLQATHIISPNRHTTNSLIDSHDIRGLFTGKLAETGYPRIDRTIGLNAERRRILRDKLGIGRDEPAVLYAPTWRGKAGQEGSDLDKLLTDLEKLQDLPCKLLVRVHPFTEQAIKARGLQLNVVPSEVDTNDLLGAIDALITDYSSIMFDFLPTRKPLLLYVYDIDEYANNRGLYFENLPGKQYADIDQLRAGITTLLMNDFPVEDGRDDALGRFCAHEDGGASKRTVEFFLHDKDDDRVEFDSLPLRSILVRESLIPNGVTTSFLNLINNIDPSQMRVTLIIDSDIVGNDAGRLEKIRALPRHVQVIGRVGQRVPLPEERWLSDKLTALRDLTNEEQWRTYMNAYEREWRRTFGDTQFDASVEYDGYSLFWASLIAAAASTVKSIYLHSDMIREWLTRASYLESLYRIYPRFDNLVSVSNVLRDINVSGVGERFDVSPDHFVFCENQLDVAGVVSKSVEPLDPDIVTWLDESATVFVTIGRLSPEKDQEKLVRAAAQLVKSGYKIQLLLVGDGPLRGELESLVSRLGLGENVMLAGHRSNPFPSLRRADCFVLSSNHEGQPMVLLESLVLGKRIVATDISGARGVLGNQHGRLVENSATGLASGMAEMLRGEIPAGSFDASRYQARVANQFEHRVLAHRSDMSSAGFRLLEERATTERR
ncbi:CDP-glycerol glycerophosphotransferase family protein [Spelaeicoccus albus]|nr:CDP-glycerol glycerophosphotransferase family protein [Spelaeicoccus albus]